MNSSFYVKIAVFFIVLGGAGTVYIITSADGLSDFKTQEYKTIVADATGLSTRSKIYLAGVAVGRVKGITLEENEAMLRLVLLRNVQPREDARITRKSSSILGTSTLTLELGNESYPIIPPGGIIISSRDASDVNAVMGTVQDLGGQISQLIKEFQENQLALLAISLETFNSVAQKINAQTDAELERISRILESMALITERMERIMAQNERDGTGPAGDIFLTLENIRIITDEIRQGRGNVGQTIFDDQLYESILSAVQRIEVAVLKLQGTLDTINTVAESAGTVIDNASVIVGQAAGLGVQVDTSGAYLIVTNQVQANASIRLIPASNDRWYRVGVSSLPNGLTTHTVKEVTNEQGEYTSRDITETAYSTFAVDAEIARQFKVLTVRGGLYENTAGLGLDLQPLNWIGASAEVFNFRTGEMPNLRGTLTIFPFFDPNSDKPWNWVYIKGGVSNSLTNSRDYFVGGGVRFADREIKGLVGLVPALNN